MYVLCYFPHARCPRASVCLFNLRTFVPLHKPGARAFGCACAVARHARAWKSYKSYPRAHAKAMHVRVNQQQQQRSLHLSLSAQPDFIPHPSSSNYAGSNMQNAREMRLCVCVLIVDQLEEQILYSNTRPLCCARRHDWLNTVRMIFVCFIERFRSVRGCV